MNIAEKLEMNVYGSGRALIWNTVAVLNQEGLKKTMKSQSIYPVSRPRSETEPEALPTEPTGSIPSCSKVKLSL
jgi:hypothetical protein